MSSYELENLEAASAGCVRDLREKGEPTDQELKMWLLVRKDLPMPPGKLAAQAGHAFSTALWIAMRRDPRLVDRYMMQAQAKIAVSVRHDQDLLACIDACRQACIPAVEIHDAGRTHFSGETLTVGAVGPCYRHELPKRVGRLQLFNGWSTEGISDA